MEPRIAHCADVILPGADFDVDRLWLHFGLDGDRRGEGIRAHPRGEAQCRMHDADHGRLRRLPGTGRPPHRRADALPRRCESDRRRATSPRAASPFPSSAPSTRRTTISSRASRRNRSRKVSSPSGSAPKSMRSSSPARRCASPKQPPISSARSVCPSPRPITRWLGTPCASPAMTRSSPNGAGSSRCRWRLDPPSPTLRRHLERGLLHHLIATRMIPAVHSTMPSQFIADSLSPRKIVAKTATSTMLSLSRGATRAASPSLRARK